MTQVLTLIGAPSLSADIAAAAQSAVAALAIEIEDPDWLAPGAACDIAFEGPDTTTIEAAVRTRLGDAAVSLPMQMLKGSPRACTPSCPR